MNSTKLEARSISKFFKEGSSRIELFSSLSLICEQGKTYGIFGESGSGKSTFLHILGGLDSPSSGEIYFNDRALSHYTPQENNDFRNKHIGFVFQFHYLISDLTVLENCMMPGLIGGRSYKECKEQAHELLNEFGLAKKECSYPLTLSGGEQQRVSIVRALFNKPAFILADEPTGNLDEKRAHAIVDVLLQAQEEWNLGIILCSHDPLIYTRMELVYELKGERLKLAKR